MTVIEATRQLGAAIQQDPAYINFAQIADKNEKNETLQNLIGEFNIKRMNLNNEVQKEDKDDNKVKELNEELRACYETIMKNEDMIAYNNAKEELDAVVNNINSIISLCLDGQDPATCEPSSCSSDCSSCAGCH